MNRSTIAAIATPTGKGGIGIIRISGSQALIIAGSIFRNKCLPQGQLEAMHDADNCSRLPKFETHRLYYGYIFDPESGRVVDEVLMAVMIAPRSYTREDVVEIHSHSGQLVLTSILELVLNSGARLADPGEFTKRAFLNGRIDLSQAEAVIDIINARTEKGLEIATAQLSGNIRTSIESTRNHLINILSEIEAAIDFPDDIDDTVDTESIAKDFQHNVVAEINKLINQYDNAHILRDGLRVMVAGRPNVGKSSIMNCLVQHERAIVTPFPGTTRDLIEETVIIRGVPVVITDAAGLHDTEDPVEIIGIQRAYQNICTADLILLVIEASDPFTAEDRTIFDKISNNNIILVINKMDLVENKFDLRIPESWSVLSSVSTSALYGRGIESLSNVIANSFLARGGVDAAATSLVPNLRHKLLLNKCADLANSVINAMQARFFPELTAFDLRELVGLLDEIIGIKTDENLLEQIFSKFCIGK